MGTQTVVGQADHETVAAGLGKLRGVVESFATVHAQTVVPGSNGKLTMDKCDLIATAAHLAGETDTAVRAAMSDKAIYPEGRIENAGKALVALVEKVTKLRDDRVPLLAQAANPPAPPPIDVPPHVVGMLLEQFLKLDPLVRGQAYLGAPAIAARALESLPVQLMVKGKGGTSWEWKPFISDEVRTQRWLQDATPLDRDRYEGARQVHAAALGYLNQLKATATELARSCGVVGRSIHQ